MSSKISFIQRECLWEISRHPSLTVSNKLEEHEKHWRAYEALERLDMVKRVREWNNKSFREYSITQIGRDFLAGLTTVGGGILKFS